MDELIDLYDHELNPLGITVHRNNYVTEPGQYALYVLAIVQDLNGKFLITQRSMDKKWAGGWWEVTGGGVGSGETIEDAVVREIGEEVGLDASKHTPKLIYRYWNDDAINGDNYINNVYLAQLDFTVDDVVLQKEEAIAARLVTWEEIEQLNDKGVFLHFKRIKEAFDAMNE